jgi:MOSC domain-containing protein YiiM
MDGRVVVVCSGQRRGEGKVRVGRAYLEREHGMQGDAHAGPHSRQVSLVALEDVIAATRAHGIQGGPCDFAANIATEGLDLAMVAAGTLITAGEALLLATEVGKRDAGPHHFSYKGVALLVEKGLFCRVLRAGWVQEGDLATIEVVHS